MKVPFVPLSAHPVFPELKSMRPQGAAMLARKWVPLGDQAVIVHLGSEDQALQFATTLQAVQPAWLQDVVPAYASVGVFFDATCVRLENVGDWLDSYLCQWELKQDQREFARHCHKIPVCYELGPDRLEVAQLTGLAVDDMIRLHLGIEYVVYAIGFVPGFPYLGYLPDELAGVPRLATPRVQVEPGSVGLAGRQTGIYPLARPGGWHLIGRTPLTIVDIRDEFFPIRVGDRVAFTRIDMVEFDRLVGERLPLSVRQMEIA